MSQSHDGLPVGEVEQIPVEVILATPAMQYRKCLLLQPGACVREAVALALQSGLLPDGVSMDVDPMTAPLGIYGEKVDDAHVCEANDRVEIYRPLPKDPMQLRRQRARQSSFL